MCAQQNELDVNLCYKALGSSVSDSPAQLEEKYQRLIRKCKTELKSDDPKIRDDAREQLIFFEEMYQQIKGSISYNTAEREEKKRALSEPQGQQRNIRGYLMHCPACNALIAKGLKACPVCKANFTTKADRIFDSFSPKTSIAAIVLLLVVAGLVVFALAFPEQIEALKRMMAK